MVAVLDFRFSQSGAAIKAPVHRPQIAVNVTLAMKLPQHGNFGRLVLGRKGQVRRAPISDCSEPNELLALRVDPFFSEFAAELAHFELWDGADSLAKVTRNLMFDRHPVTVPSGHKRRAITHHRARTHDKILQNLVECGAEMNPAIGVGRAIVEHPWRCVLASLHQPPVEAASPPIA